MEEEDSGANEEDPIESLNKLPPGAQKMINDQSNYNEWLKGSVFGKAKEIADYEAANKELRDHSGYLSQDYPLADQIARYNLYLNNLGPDVSGAIRSPVMQGIAAGMVITYRYVYRKDFFVNYAKNAFSTSLKFNVARAIGGATDAGGQLAYNWYSTGSFSEGFKKVNWSSPFMTALNPTNSFGTYAFNGLVSNTLQVNIQQDWFNLGTTNEIMYGTMAEITFGLGGGKVGNGFIQKYASKSRLNMDNALEVAVKYSGSINPIDQLKAKGYYKLYEGYSNIHLLNRGVVFPSISGLSQTWKNVSLDQLEN